LAKVPKHPSLFELSEDEEMLRDSAERFAKEILAPHVQAEKIARELFSE